MTDHPASEWAFDGHGRLYDLSQPPHVVGFGPPEPIRWTNVTDLGNSLGQRAAVSRPHQVLYDQRIASGVYDHLGALWVNVCHEQQWWEWLAQDPRPDRIPRSTPYRALHVWVEIRTQRSCG